MDRKELITFQETETLKSFFSGLKEEAGAVGKISVALWKVAITELKLQSAVQTTIHNNGSYSTEYLQDQSQTPLKIGQKSYWNTAMALDTKDQKKTQSNIRETPCTSEDTT